MNESWHLKAAAAAIAVAKASVGGVCVRRGGRGHTCRRTAAVPDVVVGLCAFTVVDMTHLYAGRDSFRCGT